VAADSLTPLAESVFSAAKFTSTDWVWNYSLVEPLIWYWRQAAVDREGLPEEWAEWDTVSAQYTPWVVIAIDFRYATGVQLKRRGKEEEDLEIGTIAKMFSAATMNLWKRAGVKLPFVKEARTLAALGLPPTASLVGRVRLVRPQHTNRALFAMGLLRLKDKIPKNWKFHFTFSDAIKPAWDGQSQHVETVTFAKEATRYAAPHSIAKQTFEFTAEQQEHMAGMTFYDRRCHERMYMQKTTARQKGWCEFDRLDRKTATLRCQVCGLVKECALKRKEKVVGIDWRRAEAPCRHKQGKATAKAAPLTDN